MKNLKPFIAELVRFYRYDLGNSSGGPLHIVLEDGNTDAGSIWYCQEEAMKMGDTYAYFLATLMREFSEDELSIMFENRWKNHS